VALGKGDVQDGFEELERFPVVMEWYRLIGEANGLDPRHPLVAEAYWLGSSLLDREYDITPIHNHLVERFPERFSDPNISPSAPSGHPPHHNLHVMTYGIISRPDSSAEDIEACKVSPVRLLSAGNVESLVDGRRLQVQDSFNLAKDYGGLVAVHSNTICSTIDDKTADAIMKYGFHM